MVRFSPNVEHCYVARLIFYLGTTGYEEAAAQGIVAGINAGLSCQHREPFILNRGEAFIGVMIDDLVLKGAEEPCQYLSFIFESLSA